MIDWGALKNFKQNEFVCHCGCGRSDMKQDFMILLQLIRTELERPMPISSGFRCSARNVAVSKSGPQGPHTTGCAVDVRCSGPTAFHLARISFALGVTGFGFKQTGNHDKRFIHLDRLGGVQRLRPRTWTYP